MTTRSMDQSHGYLAAACLSVRKYRSCYRGRHCCSGGDCHHASKRTAYGGIDCRRWVLLNGSIIISAGSTLEDVDVALLFLLLRKYCYTVRFVYKYHRSSSASTAVSFCG